MEQQPCRVGLPEEGAPVEVVKKCPSLEGRMAYSRGGLQAAARLRDRERRERRRSLILRS